MLATLIGACLLSSASAFAQDSPAVPPSPQVVDPNALANPLAGIAVSDMTSFLSRPLFSVSRRPALPAATIAAPAPAPPPVTVSTAENLQLVGTLASDTGRLALIRDTARAETVSVADGDLVDGWRVVEIQSALVRIERDARTVSLEMFRPGAVPPPPAATPGRPAVAAAQSGAIAPVASPPAPQAGAAPGAAPPGTVAGTAAAAVAAQSPYRLTFGAPPPAQP
ncbi:hypothetical protein [Aureimonas sp. AU12]|uniref:hypothetical protein n=1 Tax=Aureimonas sp. AU12 TaxID=1638161 RepID=UPI0007807A2C|nr:hypothetical protein [Aureimonas sp. AU12]